jgi:hypothetical protein
MAMMGLFVVVAAAVITPAVLAKRAMLWLFLKWLLLISTIAKWCSSCCS